MRIIMLDLEGASRDYFDSRQELVDALEELEAEEPGTAAELFVATYDDDGRLVAELERGDEVLEQYSRTLTYAYGLRRADFPFATAAAVLIRDASSLPNAQSSPAAGTSRVEESV